jgi:hypothetical protein
MSALGLRPEKGCTDDAQQKLKITDPTSRQRGHPTSTNPQLSKDNQREKGNNWSQVPDGCLTPRQTGRLNVGHNIALTLKGITQCPGGYNWATLFLGEINTGTWPSRLGESQK